MFKSHFYIIDGLDEYCDGMSPVKDLTTGSEFDCTDNKAICPQGSYCHEINGKGKCCKGGNINIIVINIIESIKYTEAEGALMLAFQL